MLFELVILLTLGFILFEVYTNLKFKAVAWFTEKFSWGGLVISLLLSLALAHVFPAVGLVVLVASVCSVVAIQPWYWMRNKLRYGNDQIKAKIERISTELREFWETFTVVLKVGFLPVWLFYRFIKIFVNHHHGRPAFS